MRRFFVLLEACLLVAYLAISSGECSTWAMKPVRRSTESMLHFRNGNGGLFASRASPVASTAVRGPLMTTPRRLASVVVRRKRDIYKSIVMLESIKMTLLGSALMAAPNRTLRLLLSTDFVSTPSLMFITQTLGAMLTSTGMTLVLYHKGLWAAPVVPFGVSAFGVLHALFALRHMKQLTWVGLGGVVWTSAAGAFLASM